MVRLAPAVALACSLVACGGADESMAGAATDGGSADAATDSGHDADRFATKVVSYTPGDGGGFGADKLPSVVEGPPHGAGGCKGSLDVVSLGNGGEIVVETGTAIVDGPGVDFLVFENAFVGGCKADESQVFAEPAEVGVSDDLSHWTTFPCTATAYPYGACAGWHPVYSSPDDGISPLDPATAGGDPYDLADLGITHARYVRIRDMGSGKGAPPTVGFDLDAIAVVNAE